MIPGEEKVRKTMNMEEDDDLESFCHFEIAFPFSLFFFWFVMRNSKREALIRLSVLTCFHPEHSCEWASRAGHHGDIGRELMGVLRFTTDCSTRILSPFLCFSADNIFITSKQVKVVLLQK